MLPSGDHNSRSIIHRRVSSRASWSEAGTSFLLADDAESVETDEHDPLSEPLLPGLEYETSDDDLLSLMSSSVRKLNWKLWLSFLFLVFSGVSSVVISKLQALPMYNYPTFLNMYSNGMYVILSFSYILPASKFGFFHHSIPWTHLTSMSKKPFMVMGLLDAIAGLMQILATIYLPGTLLVLLPQAAIPLSMLASRFILREHFTPYQYLGAFIVFMGIVVVLVPVLTHQRVPDFYCKALDEDEDCAVCATATTQEICESHKRSNGGLDPEGGDDVYYCQWISKEDALRKDDLLKFVWSLVMVASCIPMVLSSVYKQVAVQVHVDPVLVNGWVSLFQFLFGLPLVIPAGYITSPQVDLWELPRNWSHAMSCLFAQNNSIDAGCHPDNCSKAALWVHLGLISSVAHTLSMILVLKYGSASLLYLGLTLMVPLGHLVFSLHSNTSTDLADIAGLIVLVAGLMLYRFGHEEEEEDDEESGPPVSPQLSSSVPPMDLDSNARISLLSTSNRGSTAGVVEEDKNGFLEFLREPFMLVGDI